jgi:hypothetical protein
MKITAPVNSKVGVTRPDTYNNFLPEKYDNPFISALYVEPIKKKH